MGYKKTLFITSFHGIISKNILNSDVLRVLSASDDLRIVVFVPEHKKDLFVKYYKYENVIFEGVNISDLIKSKINTLFSRISILLVDSHYLYYKKRERLNASKSIRGYLKYSYEIIFTKLFSSSKLARKIFRFFDYYLAPKNFFESYFNFYKPDCVFVTDIFDKVDIAFLREAKHKKAYTIGMVRSWDNCYSKGLLRVLPDKLIVNNDLIKEEAIKLHDVKNKNIFVGGLPQFDNFLIEKRLKRDEFYKKIGANPDKKIIMFSPVGFPLSTTDWQICQILKDAQDDKTLSSDLQFLVRLHPGRDLPLGNFINNGNFIFDKPGVGEGKDVEFRPSDVNHLADSIFYSSIVIWVATTLGIDALVYDKPQIAINFDGFENKTYIESIKRYYNEDHMKKFLDIGGVSVVNNKEDLILWINKYLNNPNINEEKRKKSIDLEFYKLDGKSGQRIANYIIENIEHFN